MDSMFKICSSLINKCTINPELYDEEHINNVIKNLEDQQKFNIVIEGSSYHEKSIFYPKYIEIVDENGGQTDDRVN